MFIKRNRFNRFVNNLTKNPPLRRQYYKKSPNGENSIRAFLMFNMLT